jgi:hypothetical protein
LQDGLVVGGAGLALGIEALEELGEIGGVEEFFRNETLFLEEPAEDEAGEEADEAGGVALVLFGLQIGGELDLRERPEILVGQLAVEAFVEQLNVENLLPSGVEGVEVGDGELLRVDEIGQREGVEDVKVAAVGMGDGDVADEGGFFEDVLGVVELVPSAVDDGDSEGGVDILVRLLAGIADRIVCATFEDYHDGHGEEAVDLAGDGGEFAAWVVGALQLDGDEDIGFEQAALDGGIGEEAGFAAEFLIGELEEEVGGFPFGDEGLGMVEWAVFGKEVEEVLRGGACVGDELVAPVAELGEKLAGGILERERLEIGEGGFHGALMTSQVTSSRSVFS